MTCSLRRDSTSKGLRRPSSSFSLTRGNIWWFVIDTKTTSVWVGEHGLEGASRTCQSMNALHQCLWNRLCARWKLCVEKCTFFFLVWLMLVTDLHELPQAHGEKLTSMAWLYCSSRLSILVIGTGGWAFFRLLLFLREKKILFFK